MNTPDTCSDQLFIAFKPVLDRLCVIARTDPALRADLRRLGESLLAVAAEPQSTEPPVETGLPASAALVTQGTLPEEAGDAATEDGPPDKEVDNPPAVSARQSTSEPQPTIQPARPLTTNRNSRPWFTQQLVPVDNTNGFSHSSPLTELDLRALAQRCAVKKEGATWAAERQRRWAQGIKNDLELEVHRFKLIEHAQSLPDCYLWMCQREALSTVDAVAFEHLAGSFDATMHIVILLDALLIDDEEDDPFLEPALNLAAEAQAALRNAITAVNGVTDNDQVKLFQWLRAVTNQYQIHIRHYMSKWNSASPAEWETLKKRIQELAAKIQDVKQVSKQRQKLLGKVRHRRRLIEKAQGQERLEDWQRLDEAVNGLIESGLPPSNLELREQLLPLLDRLPEAVEFSKNFQLVLREIDRFLATRSSGEAELDATMPIEEVLRVRTLLQGQTIVLIGGERRPAAATALTTAFDLQELIWIEGHDQTYTDFEPHIARPEVNLVLLAIRWSRHGFGEVKDFCDRYSKPLVRLLGGYNPNQVAYTILNQVSHQLEAGQLRDQDEA